MLFEWEGDAVSQTRTRHGAGASRSRLSGGGGHEVLFSGVMIMECDLRLHRYVLLLQGSDRQATCPCDESG